MTATLRRRLDNVALRLQARLEVDDADRVLPWVLAGGLFVLLAALALATARSLEAAPELSVYTQATWLIRQGDAPLVTVGGQATDLLAQHAGFALYPLVGLTYVLPTVPALLLAQSAALALGVVPLWRICRRLAHLRVGTTVAVAFAYACYPLLHDLNLAGFHPEVVAVPGLLTAFYLGWSRPAQEGRASRWALFGLACAVVVASRADLGLAVAGLGGLLALDGRRRAGLVTAAAGLGWVALAALVVQPALGDGTFPHLSSLTAFGDSPGSVAWGLLTDPLEVVRRLFDRENLDLAILLFAPLLFLPLLAPRYLLPVVPLEVLYLVADVPPEARLGPQAVAVAALSFVAAAFALSRIGRPGVEFVVVDRRVVGALVVAAAVFFVADAASSPYEAPWRWGGQDVVDDARHAAADVVGPDAPVRTTPSMLQLLAERRQVHAFDPATVPDPARLVDGVDAVVVDGADTGHWAEADLRALELGLARQGFRPAFDQEGVLVWRR